MLFRSTVSISGSAVGDAIVISINGNIPAGILIYGTKVAVAGQGTMKVCNFTGGAQAAITNLPVSIFTIDI